MTPTPMQVRKPIKVMKADLPKIQAIADEFYASSKFLDGFKVDRFIELWSGLLDSGTGIIFAYEGADGWTGAIGGIAYAEPYSGELIATEMFWFCRENHRGDGVRLYREFEKWAKEWGCNQVRMVHLLDSMPEKLEKFYKHMGYTAAEVHYVKQLEVKS